MTLASWASCNVYQVAAGRVGLLGETMVAQPRPKRVTISYRSFVSLLKWHRANSDRIRQARAEVQAWQLNQTAPIERPWREYVGLVAAPTTEAIGYKTDPLPRDLAQIHGIEIVDGIASTQQKVRPLVVAVMDPDSFYKSVDGIPIFNDLPVEKDQNGNITVKVNGLRYKVERIIAKKDGTRYPVGKIVTKRDGVRYEV